MLSIHSLIPEPEDLLSLEPEELAGFVLQLLNSTANGRGPVSSGSLISEDWLSRNYPTEHIRDIRYALVEALVWLENEGLIATDPYQRSNDYRFITRRGQKQENAADVETYRKTKLLPKELLHPTLANKVWSLFSRGNYDNAVFQAFKEVEVAVRDAGEYSEEDCDVELMEKAFNHESGKLTVETQTDEEKQATLALFAGAMGLYKKQTCHRNLNIKAEEASEIIIFASHLLKIVDS